MSAALIFATRPDKLFKIKSGLHVRSSLIAGAQVVKGGAGTAYDGAWAVLIEMKGVLPNDLLLSTHPSEQEAEQTLDDFAKRFNDTMSEPGPPAATTES